MLDPFRTAPFAFDGGLQRRSVCLGEFDTMFFARSFLYSPPSRSPTQRQGLVTTRLGLLLVLDCGLFEREIAEVSENASNADRASTLGETRKRRIYCNVKEGVSNQNGRMRPEE